MKPIMRSKEPIFQDYADYFIYDLWVVQTIAIWLLFKET